MITKRHVFLATLLMGLLLVWLSISISTAPIHADDDDEPAVRPTPTPARPLSAERRSPDMPQVPEDDYPDLVISDISVSPDPPLVDRAVTIQVRISNIGTIPISDTNNFFVDLYINPDDPPRACLLGDYFWSVQGFEMSSNSLTLSETFYPEEEDTIAVIREAFTDVGIVNIWAQVDTGADQANNDCGNVIEEREDNNLDFITIDVDTRFAWLQTEAQEFLQGFSSALDLTHPLGILQNGTGWFEEPRFPPPEEPGEWPFITSSSPSFYNPDRHIWTDYLPDDYPLDQLDQWNPADQENVDIEIGFTPETLYATWEDGRNGDLFDRDIFFSYSPDSGRTWLNPPIQINDSLTGTNQLRPQLVVDRKGLKLYIFWEDNRLGDYDIFFARSNDFGFSWDEPDLTINPINDKEVDPNANQINVTAAAYYEDNCGRITCTHLFVAWEDYRNDNADIFFDWSQDGGDTWLKTEDGNSETVDANIHVQPDPDTNAGVYDQQRPHLFLDNTTSEGTINYCITRGYRIIYYENDVPVLDTRHYYPQNPLPRVFIVWQDERDSAYGDPYSIYYTRGEFNYVHPDIPENQFGVPITEATLCENDFERPATAQSNLPKYRFEDDHVKVNSEITPTLQLNPVGGFDDDGFISFQFNQTTGSEESGQETLSYLCEIRFQTDELVISWEDNRNGTFDIWSTNIFDEIEFFNPVYVYVFDPDPTVSNPPTNVVPEIGCLSVDQGGIGNVTAPTSPPDEIDVIRNIAPLSPQPPEFYELSLPEQDIQISNGLTFTPKPLCPTPNETATFSPEPSEQITPDLAVLPIPPNRITQSKLFAQETLIATFSWNAWSDSRTIIDRVNQDILLRPVVREDTSRQLTVLFSENMTPELPSFRFGERFEIALQTVQDNIKNQVVLRDLTLVDDLQPPNAQQYNPSVSFAFFGDENNPTDVDNLENYVFYTGWDDNRNANPLIGFEGNKDVFAARLRLDDVLYDVLRPGRTGSYVSAVFDVGEVATWYDIEWWGDISADGVVNFQTRFGNNPTPPQENITENGWTQWTGIGGTGGTYTAPGQHIADTDGEQLPQYRYIQFRVNFNPAGGGQQDISCISEVNLNYELPLDFLYLPLIIGDDIQSGTPTPTPAPVPSQGTVEGQVVDAAGSPLSGATVCTLSSNICATTDADGNYLLSLAEGDYTLRITIDGYLQIDQKVTIEVGQSVTLNVAFPAPSRGAVEGQVVDVVTALPISGATVCTLSSNICATTDADGNYLLSLAEGNYILRITIDGYVQVYKSVTIEVGQSVTLNVALSPTLDIGEMRLVLTWGETPLDIDSHLWLPEANPYHIDWTNKGDCDSFPYACLELEDANGNGPEIITIKRRENGTYVYAVFQFSSDAPLTTSGARLQVYNSTGLIRELDVPTSGDGRWWHVLDIDGATGGMTVHNTISTDSPGPYDPDPFIRKMEKE